MDGTQYTFSSRRNATAIRVGQREFPAFHGHLRSKAEDTRNIIRQQHLQHHGLERKKVAFRHLAPEKLWRKWIFA